MKKIVFRDFRVSVNNRLELVDYDYTHKLSPDEYVWLMRFNSEHVNASFNYDTGTICTSKQVLEIYKENNRRNGDLFNELRRTGKLESLSIIKSKIHETGKKAVFFVGEIDIEEELFNESVLDVKRSLELYAEKYPKQSKLLWR